MLIFEFMDEVTTTSVPSEQRAEMFAEKCRQSGKQAFVWPDQDAMEEAFNREVDGEWLPAPGSDIFPFELFGIVVTVERDDDLGVEREFEHLVDSFGGRFAGT
jgi:hypothetical protein